jgi:hypothetical protein
MAPNGALVELDFKTYSIKIPDTYSAALSYPAIEDFVVAAYMAIRIIAATKNGRSAKDVARFAVALYSGMRTMVVSAQKAAGDDVNWAPVEIELIKRGHKDEVAYVNEVVK